MLSDQLKVEWGVPLERLGTLDAMFGNHHGLLGDGPWSYALTDGIWEHDGWKPMAEVQAQLRDMPLLRTLIRDLGRRPSASGELRRGPPTQSARNSPPGVSWSSETPFRVEGLRRSGDLSRLLPSEMALLAAGRHEEAVNSRAGKNLRRLFLSKLVEKRLMTYELSNWVDETARPDLHRRFRPLRPRGPGGPIIVCLDTSQSMEGLRERVAKAVVLEAVRAAHVQHRHCCVFAFSGGSNLAVCELDAVGPGLAKLLEFLAYSFNGGTDVAGPLRRALTYLEDQQWAESDILLVSDGELPIPPVGPQTMHILQQQRREKGLEVHGLLMKPGASPAMNMICDHIHDFLAQYDPFT